MSDEAIYKEFGRSVAKRRAELKLTQAQLAVQVRMSRASIANIESGRQNVLLHHVYSLANALKCNRLSDLLPTPAKPASGADLDVDLSDQSITPRGKAQITDLIASALAHRTPPKAES